MDGCLTCPEVHRYFFNRGSKSRNKVAVGEPAAGSFTEKSMISTKQPSRACVYCACALLTKTKLKPSRCKMMDFPSRAARPSQRVAMDDLASHFVEERSKVR